MTFLQRKLRSSNTRAIGYALLITFAAILLSALVLGLYPFGDSTLIFTDGDQYLAFNRYLQQTFTTGSNWLYSFSRALGGEAISAYGYYASSPLHVLFLLFPNNFLLGTVLITGLKLLLASAFFCGFLNSRYEGDELMKGLFSTCYALMGYTAFYLWNPTWMDGVFILPLLLTGLRRLLEKKRPQLYLLSLAYALFANYYIGYMLCLFVVICYLLYLLEEKGQFAARLKQSFLRFAGCSVLAAGLSAVLLIPVFSNLPQDRLTDFFSWFQFENLNGEVFHVLSMLYSCAITTADEIDLSNNPPVIFVGALSMVLVISYFINRDIKGRRKLTAGLLLLFFLICFLWSPLNALWHGFTQNAWFNYRYSFLVSFLLLAVAYEAYRHFPTGKADLWKTAGVLLLMTVLIFETERRNFSAASVTMDVLFGLLGLILLFYIVNKTGKAVVWRRWLLVVTVLANVLNSNWFTLTHPYCEIHAADYLTFESDSRALLEAIPDDDFYRLSSTVTKTRCDPFLLNYAGVFGFDSTVNQETHKLASNFCIDWTGGRAIFYYGKAPFAAESYLNLRYLITDTDENPKGYELLKEQNGLYLYRNNYTLPLVFPAEWISESENPDNYFANQNAYWDGVAGGRFGRVYTLLQPEMTCSGDGNTDVTLTFGELPEGNLYLQIPIIRYNVSVTVCYTDGTEMRIPFRESQSTFFIPAEGGRVPESLVLHSNSGFNTNYIYTAVEHPDIVRQNLASLQAVPQVTVESSSRLSFISTLEEDHLYSSTIPYDENWSVIIDGQRYLSKGDEGGFLAFYADGGTHEITLIYTPRGWIAGKAVTLLTVLVLLWLEIRYRKKAGYGPVFANAAKGIKAGTARLTEKGKAGTARLTEKGRIWAEKQKASRAESREAALREQAAEQVREDEAVEQALKAKAARAAGAAEKSEKAVKPDEEIERTEPKAADRSENSRKADRTGHHSNESYRSFNYSKILPDEVPLENTQGEAAAELEAMLEQKPFEGSNQKKPL